jgi:Uma2 family endonuclease
VVAASSSPAVSGYTEPDQRIVLRGMSWKDFEVVLAVRGEAAGVRMYYLDGEIELMSPSPGHENLKKWVARLLEAWADEMDVELNGFGSWTLKAAPNEAGAEPDECYVLGPVRGDVPDLVIEVAWSRGGLAKLEIYRRLGVREVWMLAKNGTMRIHVLAGDRYVEAKKSRLLPKLDVSWLFSFLDRPTQSQASRALRDALRKKRG